MNYVEAIDHLMGFVGQDVLVRVSDREHHAGFVTCHGKLAQGEAMPDFGDGDTACFGLGSRDGIFIPRDEYADASYSAEDERLTIWIGPVAVTIEPSSASEPVEPEG